MSRATRSSLGVIAFLIALAGCGSADHHISDAARKRLTPLVEKVRQAAEADDRPGAERALTDLQRAVGRYEHNGEIGAASAAEILGAAAQVRSQLVLVTTTTTTTTTTTEPDHSGDKKHPDKGNGKDEHGHD